MKKALLTIVSFAFASVFVSEVHAASCPGGYGQIAAQSRSALIVDMKAAAAKAKMSTITVREAEGKVVLDIGFIHNDDVDIVRLLPAGLRVEAWDEVACGRIVGPKFPGYLVRMISSVKEGSKTKFTGQISPSELIRDQIEERQLGLKNTKTESGAKEPLFWGPTETRNFRNSFDQLQVTDACLRLYETTRLEECGTLFFEITPGTNQFIFRKP